MIQLLGAIIILFFLIETGTDLPGSFGLDAGALQSAKNKTETDYCYHEKGKRRVFKGTKLRELQLSGHRKELCPAQVQEYMLDVTISLQTHFFIWILLQDSWFWKVVSCAVVK